MANSSLAQANTSSDVSREHLERPISAGVFLGGGGEGCDTPLWIQVKALVGPGGKATGCSKNLVP